MLLGHAETRTTADLYGLVEQTAAGAATKMEGILGAATQP